MDTESDSSRQVSVVICTRNRGAKIGTAVASVLAQDHPSFDLTVIDQSTDDGSEEAVKPLMAADGRLRYFRVDEVGLSRAYNNGIRRTTGTILAFTDDDCIVAPDWLSTIVAAFEGEPDGDLLYGRVVPFDEPAHGDHLTPVLDITKPERLSKSDGFKVFGMGANFAARRRLFDRIGGFDEILGGGGALRSSQDYDMTYRAYKAGLVTLLRPEVMLRHDGRREQEDWPALLVAYGTGDGAFYMKHARCRDPYAMWIMSKRFSVATAKWVVKRYVLRRSPRDLNYIKGFIAGMRGSFKFGVDRRARLYVER